MKNWLLTLLCASLVFLPLRSSYAQVEGGEGGAETDFVKNTQQDIMLVAAAGGAGAILGLSTLSFYETPSKHIRNIWTGAALGIIAGVIFVAYSSAQKGQEELQNEQASVEFSTNERAEWHEESSPFLTMQSVQFGTQIWQTTF